MRPLTGEETELVFEKLKRYVGANIRQLIDRSDDVYVFRLHKNKVYYLSESIVKKAAHAKKDNLLSAGVCFGKFTHSKRFHLSVTCLDFLSKLAQYKVWLKPNGEQHFVYGNHIVKAHLRRITEDVPRNAGVVIYSENDLPLGFGTAARSTGECRDAPTEAIVVYHQSDVGEYLREEANLL